MPDRPLRFLVGADVPPDPNSGAAGTVYHTNQALRALGHEVDEIWAGDLGRRIRHGNLHYLLELPRAYRAEVRKRCARKDYDVIQLDQPHAYLAAEDHQKSKRDGIFVNRSHGLELRAEGVLSAYQGESGQERKLSPRSLLGLPIQRILRSRWPRLMSAVDGIIVGCDEDRRFLCQDLGVPKDKVQAIAQGIPDHFVQLPPMEAARDRFKKFLYVGQFSYVKGPHVLAAILNRVLPLHADVEFTWVCSATHHKHARELLSQEIVNRVQFLNWIAQYELAEVYLRHGMFIFPSLFEGFGKAPLEAMAAGLCVVASNTGGMRDYIRYGRNGYLVKVGDVDGFVEVIEHVLASPDLAIATGAEARRDAQSYTWKRCAEEAIRFYFQLLDPAARRLS